MDPCAEPHLPESGTKSYAELELARDRQDVPGYCSTGTGDNQPDPSREDTQSTPFACGHPTFESDHLMSTPYCSSRFSKPVNFAIFVYGHAPEDGDTGKGPAELPEHLRQAEEAADELDDDVDEADIRPSTHTYAHGIRFIGLSREQVPAEIHSLWPECI